MKTPALVKALEEAHQHLGIAVRRERGPFRGGRCLVDGHEVVVLNKRQPAEAQLAVLAESLRTLPVEQLYLRPSVRVALEDAWAARAAGAVSDGSDAFDEA
ncbi:MAG: hypothetical protein HKN04_15425 [Rhodothermaceae bacterium]|nr:hypothetical protein [Rhodothermaceae bacterium]